MQTQCSARCHWLHHHCEPWPKTPPPGSQQTAGSRPLASAACEVFQQNAGLLETSPFPSVVANHPSRRAQRLRRDLPNRWRGYHCGPHNCPHVSCPFLALHVPVVLEERPWVPQAAPVGAARFQVGLAAGWWCRPVCRRPPTAAGHLKPEHFSRSAVEVKARERRPCVRNPPPRRHRRTANAQQQRSCLDEGGVPSSGVAKLQRQVGEVAARCLAALAKHSHQRQH